MNLRWLTRPGFPAPAPLFIPGRFTFKAAPPEERLDEQTEEEWWLQRAFEAPPTLLPSLLWCAFAKDFGNIRPRTACSVYLFNLKAEILVFPYDDRGMDIVGPNHKMLSNIYFKHKAMLLDDDKEAMAETFERCV